MSRNLKALDIATSDLDTSVTSLKDTLASFNISLAVLARATVSFDHTDANGTVTVVEAVTLTNLTSADTVVARSSVRGNRTYHLDSISNLTVHPKR